MRALHHTPTGYRASAAHESLIRTVCNRMAQISETLWLCTTFLLFIVMGPFSVIAVLYGLWSLATGENKETMVEPASLMGN